MLLLKSSRRRNEAAPYSGGSSHRRTYTHDTSVRKGGTTKPKAKVHRNKSNPRQRTSGMLLIPATQPVVPCHSACIVPDGLDTLKNETVFNV